jgi:hypothetical protein
VDCPHPHAEEGFHRLQQLLLAMRVGDEIALDSAARMSGLSEDTCRAVLDELARAGLMSAAPADRFVRRSIDAMAS